MHQNYNMIIYSEITCVTTFWGSFPFLFLLRKSHKSLLFVSITCLNIKCFMYTVNIWKLIRKLFQIWFTRKLWNQLFRVIQNQLLKCLFIVWLQGRILCTFSRITLWRCHQLNQKLLSDQGMKMTLKYLSPEIAIPQFMTRGVNYSKQFQSICF